MKKTLIIITLTLCSCGMFKQSSKISNQELEEVKTDKVKQIAAHTDISKNILSSHASVDSLNNDYHYILFPKNNFSISADGTMSGNLDSLIVKGRIAKATYSQDLTAAQEKVEKKLTRLNNASTTSLVKKKSVEKFKKSNINVLIIYVVLSILLMYWLKSRK